MYNQPYNNQGGFFQTTFQAPMLVIRPIVYTFNLPGQLLSHYTHPLLTSVRNDNINATRRNLTRSNNIDEIESALYEAIDKGQADIISCIINMQPDIMNKLPGNGSELLFYAIDKAGDAHYNFTKKSSNNHQLQSKKEHKLTNQNYIAMMFIRAGANTDYGSSDELTDFTTSKAFSHIVSTGNTKLVTNALNHMVKTKNRKLVEDYLNDNPDDINSTDAYGNTPLHIAAENLDIDMITLLMARGADSMHRNDIGDTPEMMMQQVELNIEALKRKRYSDQDITDLQENLINRKESASSKIREFELKRISNQSQRMAQTQHRAWARNEEDTPSR